MRFHVVPRTGEATPSCVLAKNKGGFTIGEDGDPLWLEALVGDYLVLTRSTGPDGDLVIYDLADPDEAVIDVPAQEMSVGEDGVSFWEVTGEADAENCPKWEENTANGFGSVILEERHFGFGEGELESSGETRCGITQ